MFVSFLLPPINEGEHARHLLVLYKQLAAFGPDTIAFIGESDYFRSPATFEAEGRSEWLRSVRELYEFEPPQSLDGVEFEALPAHIVAKAIARGVSSWGLYRQMVQRRLPKLEAVLVSSLNRLAERIPIEGIITFVNMPSLAAVARQRGLPLIQCEFGPVRKPAYAMTGYWNRCTSTALADARRRFRTFAREAAGQGLALLEREELLYVLRREVMPEIPAPSDAPYRLGIALQGDDQSYAHSIWPLDLHALARRQFAWGDILIRHHAMALTRCSELLGPLDSSATATEFISKCETILTLSSGTAFEAMLLGRKCVVVGDSAFALAADRSFEPARRRSERERQLALNFLVFGYIVPFELMFDTEYTRWRLSDPPEIEIAQHHQRWYRSRLMQLPPEKVGLTLSTTTKLLGALPRTESSAAIVFGAGMGTTALVAHLRTTRFHPIAVFDNDAAKWGGRVEGLPIARPAYSSDTSVIVSSLTHADEMVSQLHELGYPADRIVRLTAAAA